MGYQLVVDLDRVSLQACRRTTERVEIDWKGCLYANQASTICWILDVSLSGARIRTPRPLRRMPGPVLSIDDIGHFPCRIVWADGHEYGVAFLEPPELLEHYLGRHLSIPLGHRFDETGAVGRPV